MKLWNDEYPKRKKLPEQEPVAAWVVLIWNLWTWVTWPWYVRKLKLAGFKRKGWMCWEYNGMSSDRGVPPE